MDFGLCAEIALVIRSLAQPYDAPDMKTPCQVKLIELLHLNEQKAFGLLKELSILHDRHAELVVACRQLQRLPFEPLMLRRISAIGLPAYLPFHQLRVLVDQCVHTATK